jgi:hypothetical protein
MKKYNYISSKLIEHEQASALSMQELRESEREREREGSELTWPPTTAIEGSESQRVGNVLPSPWSPSAVQALWILFTKEIRFSISDRSCLSRRRQIQIGRIRRPARKICESDSPTLRERERERGLKFVKNEARIGFGIWSSQRRDLAGQLQQNIYLYISLSNIRRNARARRCVVVFKFQCMESIFYYF